MEEEDINYLFENGFGEEEIMFLEQELNLNEPMEVFEEIPENQYFLEQHVAIEMELQIVQNQHQPHHHHHQSQQHQHQIPNQPPPQAAAAA